MKKIVFVTAVGFVVAASANAAADAGITTLLSDVGATWDDVCALGLAILAVILLPPFIKKMRIFS